MKQTDLIPAELEDSLSQRHQRAKVIRDEKRRIEIEKWKEVLEQGRRITGESVSDEIRPKEGP